MPTPHMDAMEVYVSESDEIIIKQDSARRRDTAMISVHPGQVGTLVRWLLEARQELTGEQPTRSASEQVLTTKTKRPKRDSFFYTWRCSCGYVDGAAVGHEGRDLPEGEKPACPRCGVRLRYRRMYNSERAAREPSASQPAT
jgi:hypothetical protein